METTLETPIVLESNLPADNAYLPVKFIDKPELYQLPGQVTIQQRKLYNIHGKANGYKEIYGLDGSWLSTVSNKYQAVEHPEIKRMASEAINSLGLDFQLKENYPHNGRDALLSYRIKGINDAIIPTLILRNTYKPGYALKIFNGAFTTVCSNGSVFGDKQGVFSHNHVSKLENKLFELEITSFIETYKNHLVDLDKMKNINVTDTMRELFIEKMESEKAKREIYSLFMNRTNSAIDNRKDNSLHSLYQSATEYFSHNKKLQATSKINMLKKVDIITTAILVA